MAQKFKHIEGHLMGQDKSKRINFLKPKKKKVKSKSYKLWIVIEERTEYEDGTEKFKDVKDTTASAGTFDELEEAIDQMEMISESHLNRP